MCLLKNCRDSYGLPISYIGYILPISDEIDFTSGNVKIESLRKERKYIAKESLEDGDWWLTFIGIHKKGIIINPIARPGTIEDSIDSSIKNENI